MASSDNDGPSGAAPPVGAAPPGATAPPDHVSKPQVYQVFHGSSADATTTPHGQEAAVPHQAPPNSTPAAGAQQNTRPPTLKEAAESIKPEDFLKVHQVPCARQGFMTGIGAGAAVGGGRFVFGATIPKSANWAVGSFLLGAIVQFEVCQWKRQHERAEMARVVEVMDRKQAEKKAKAEEAARARREAAEREAEAKKRWYRFW